MERKRASMLVLVVAAMVTATGACASPGNSPVPHTASQAAPTTHAGMTRFDSTRYHFTVTLPNEWTAVDASLDWDGIKLQGRDSPEFTTFHDPATGRTLVAGAAPIADGMQLAAWRAAMVRAAPSFCSDSTPEEQSTLGGESALAWTGTCEVEGLNTNRIVALHGHRGYVVFLVSDATLGVADNRSTFESIRESFRFTD